MSDDLFGLDREAKIIKSAVREYFRPHEPINSKDLFFGRQGEVKRILECVTTPGLHALLFGERGVGKSSLANLASEVLLSDLMEGNLVTIRCDSHSTFQTVSRELLEELEIETGGGTRTESHTQGGEAGVQLPGIAKGGINTSRTKTSTREEHGIAVTPAGVMRAVKDSRALVVVDEFDAMRDPADRQAFAELIKLLSDAGAEVKLIVVGIASSAADLVAGHQSVHRHVREVELPRMSDAEIRQIVVGNATKARLEFDEGVVAEIIELSAGYPHFAQLLGLACAENAVGEDRTAVGPVDMQAALASAVQNAEGSLRRSYQDSVRSFSTDMFRKVVAAAANIEGTEFTAADWRGALGEITGTEVTQNELNNYLQKLVGDSHDMIIHRVAKGVYRFTDPRMKSYVRIAYRGSG